MQLPDVLLRSVLRFDQEPEAQLVANLHAICGEVEAEGIDQDILNFVTDLYDRSHQMPDYGLVRGHYDALMANGDQRGLSGMTRLETLALVTPAFLTGAPFRYALDQYRLELLGFEVSRTVSEVATVIGPGVPRTSKGKTTVLQGPNDAFETLLEGVTRITKRVKRVSSEGSIRGSVAAALRDYDARRNSPGLSQGVLSGIDEIDAIHQGIRPGDLAFVLGFTGHMKTTLCMNWAANAAVAQGRNVAIVSTEMSLFEVQVMLHVIHANHPKWRGRPGDGEVTYDRVIFGQLDPVQELLYKDAVTDLGTNPAYGEIFIKEPTGQLTVDDIFRWAHEKDRVAPLSLLVIDYLGHVDAAVDRFALENMANLNMSIKATKDHAVAFERGRGLAVLTPFQANREGLKEAEKNLGRYTLRAFSNANEAERSADLAYSVFLDDNLRAAKELCIGNLKTRKVPMLTDLIQVHADPGLKRIETGNQASTGAVTAGLI